MNVAFDTLFTVAIGHAFYPSRCRDFDFIVPAATRRTLASGMLLARPMDGALHVLFEATDAGKPRCDISASTLLFGLRLNNRRLGNFTGPPIADAAMTPLFANTTAPASLDKARPVRLASGFHVHRPQEGTRPVTVTLRVPGGADAVATRHARPGPLPAWDLRALPAGLYEIEESYAGGVKRTSEVLLAPDLAGLDVWGLLAVRIHKSFYGAAPALTVHLEPLEQPLEYYVVTRGYTQAEVDQLAVADRGHAASGLPEVKFQRVPLGDFGGDELAPFLAGAPPAPRLAVFRSTVPVQRRLLGLRNLQLERNGESLVENLPQAGMHQPRPQFVIHLTKK